MTDEFILIEAADQRQFQSVQNKIANDTYTDQDFKLLLNLLKKHTDKMDLLQTKRLCELVQYLYKLERDERLPDELLEIVNGMFYRHH